MKHILIMEDNVSLAFEWQDAFENDGHTVTLTHNGDDAIAYLKNTWFDLVITDMFVPKGKGGLNVIGRLLTMQGMSPPTIAVTGTRRSKDANRETNFFLDQASQLGVSETIEKPFPPEALIAMAHKIWGNA